MAPVCVCVYGVCVRAVWFVSYRNVCVCNVRIRVYVCTVHAYKGMCGGGGE